MLDNSRGYISVWSTVDCKLMAFVGNYRLLVGRKGRTFDEDWPKLHPEGQKVRVSLLALVAESGVILHHGVRTVQGHLKSRNQRANVFK